MGQRDADRKDEQYSGSGARGDIIGSTALAYRKIDEDAVQDFELEQFSRRWFAENSDGGWREEDWKQLS